jgi:hypothetical protein
MSPPRGFARYYGRVTISGVHFPLLRPALLQTHMCNRPYLGNPESLACLRNCAAVQQLPVTAAAVAVLAAAADWPWEVPLHLLSLIAHS